MPSCWYCYHTVGNTKISLVSVLMYCPTVYFVHTAIMCLAVVKFLSITTVCIVFTDEELLHEERKRQSTYPNPHQPPVNIPCHFFVCVMLKLSFPPYRYCIITKELQL